MPEFYSDSIGKGTMRLLIFLLCASAWGQTTITITDTITKGAGILWSGVVQRSNPDMTCGGVFIPAETVRITVNAGVYSDTLVVTADGACAGNPAYTVRYYGTGQATAYWRPAVTTTTIAQMQSGYLPTPTFSFGVNALAIPSPGSAGCLGSTDGVTWSSALLPCGGGGGGGTGAVSSVFGRTGIVVASAGDYSAHYAGLSHNHPWSQITSQPTIPSNTSQLAENGNLFYTDARVRAAMSGTSPIVVNGTTGAISCPTCQTSPYTLPAASASTLGGIKIGSGLTIDGNGVASVSAGGTGTVTSVGLALPAEFSVSNSPVTGAGNLTGTWVSQVAKWVLAAPNASAGTPTFRALLASDIPALAYAPQTSGTAILKGNGSGGFTAAVADSDYAAAPGSQTANRVYAAPNGSAGTPTFRALVAADIPALSYGNITNSGTPVVNTLPKYTSTTGTAVAPSGVTVDASNNVSTPGTISTGGAASGSVMFSGSTSGSAKITVGAAAGTPADWVLPSTTGASGQVLSTNGGTPQILSWVSAGGSFPVTTKGDLFTYTTAAARLGVGTDGQVLKANSATASGLEWATASGGGDVVSSSANSYTAGAKQTFAASATTAGIKITAAALPSSPATGDLAVDSGASNALKYYNGSAWVTPGGGGSSLSPAEITASGQGWWWLWGTPQTFVAGGASVALRTYFATFTLTAKVSFADIAYRIHTGASTSPTTKVFAFGFYNSACDTLLASANKVNLTAGYYSAPLDTRLTLDPGVYYFAYTTEDTVVQLSSAGQAFNSFTPMFNSARTPMFYGNASTQAGGSGTTITLPASCGTRTATSGMTLPHILLIP